MGLEGGGGCQRVPIPDCGPVPWLLPPSLSPSPPRPSGRFRESMAPAEAAAASTLVRVTAGIPRRRCRRSYIMLPGSPPPFPAVPCWRGGTVTTWTLIRWLSE